MTRMTLATRGKPGGKGMKDKSDIKCCPNDD
jgi:hypothetical protein